MYCYKKIIYCRKVTLIPLHRTNPSLIFFSYNGTTHRVFTQDIPCLNERITSLPNYSHNTPGYKTLHWFRALDFRDRFQLVFRTKLGHTCIVFFSFSFFGGMLSQRRKNISVELHRYFRVVTRFRCSEVVECWPYFILNLNYMEPYLGAFFFSPQE